MEYEPQPGVEIRRASVEDTGAILGIYRRCYRRYYPNPHPPYAISQEMVEDLTATWSDPERIEEMKEVYQTIIDDESQFLKVFTKDSIVVGFVTVVTLDAELTGGVTTKRLDALFTDPDAMHEGVGSLLMDEADIFIGDDPVELEVLAYNQRAINFYKKRGFEIVESAGTRIHRKVLPMITMRRKGAAL